MDHGIGLRHAVELAFSRELAPVLAEQEAARLGPGVMVACSGGPDSTVLLDLLARLAPTLGLRLSVGTVDHGLRPEAAAEVELVRATARLRGLPCATRRLEGLRPRPAEARAARYEALAECARELQATVIVLGHTATDQAETLLDRMIRGAGSRGLGGMRPLRELEPGLWLWRPLLTVTRAEIMRYALQQAIDFVEDPSNASRATRRGRLRHDVMPLLGRERPALDAALADLARRLREDEDCLTEMATEARTLASDEGSPALDAGALRTLHVAVRGRVLRDAAPVPLEEAHLSALLSLVDSSEGTSQVDLPEGWRAERTYEWLTFRLDDPQGLAPALRTPVTAAGRYQLGERVVDVPADALATAGPGATFELRYRRPGDRVLVRGRHRKLQDLLVDRKIPRSRRDSIPLLVCSDAGGEVVVWVDLS